MSTLEKSPTTYTHTSSAPEPPARPQHPRGTAGLVLNEKYQLVREIGRGGMGSVWLAEHLVWKASVAVKVMSPPDTDIGRERFEREVRLAATLRSPHVVQLLDHGIDTVSSSPFIVMELLEGESLADRLRRLGRLASREVLSVVTDIGRALTRAHSAGIVHRDLKPDNIFLVENGDCPLAKVLDFGVAKWVDSSIAKALTAEGRAVGTAWYMSPEQLKGLPLEHRADLWSLAIIAFECTTGKRPFEEYDIPSITRLLCDHPRPIPSMLGPVPVGFDEWFARATAYEPAERFQSVQHLVEGLRAVCEATPPERIEPIVSQRHSLRLDPPSTPPISRTHEVAPTPLWRRSPLVMATIVAVLVLCAISNFIIFTHRKAIFSKSASDDSQQDDFAATAALPLAPAAMQPPAATLLPPPEQAAPVSVPPAPPPTPSPASEKAPLPSPDQTMAAPEPQRAAAPQRPRRSPSKKATGRSPAAAADDISTIDGDRIIRRRL